MIRTLVTFVLAAFAFAFAAHAAVDVNKATQAELETIKGIGPSMSTKILEERKKGSFKDWNDMVSRVRGVGSSNATKFSADGLTVDGAAYQGGAPAATKKTAKAKDDNVAANTPAPATPEAKPAKK
jgi:competence protein ComEA